MELLDLLEKKKSTEFINFITEKEFSFNYLSKIKDIQGNNLLQKSIILFKVNDVSFF